MVFEILEQLQQQSQLQKKPSVCKKSISTYWVEWSIKLFVNIKIIQVNNYINFCNLICSHKFKFKKICQIYTRPKKKRTTTISPIKISF